MARLDRRPRTELARLHGITEGFFAVTLQRRFPSPLLSDLLHAFPRRAG